ncbi:YnjH family protein [Brenneria izbisi]|uniref:YnjH family protein n=1 Tax=Brenneria izbisi TaxID=2939450 RepID=A0AA42C3L7_9GAMM|nr:YnjH family protein [Brenneria izbisi]MCV9877344.1 YnjH family protein [Brenneria izbisi]MCV9881090.1 YnjH family protein [Brenneria izbisi]
MRLRAFMVILGAVSALPSMVLANRGETDIVVPVPAEVWGSGSASRGQQQNTCIRCCVYENRNYSEGAVLKTEGVLLQCVRDKQTLGTNNLIWQLIKQ